MFFSDELRASLDQRLHHAVVPHPILHVVNMAASFFPQNKIIIVIRIFQNQPPAPDRPPRLGPDPPGGERGPAEDGARHLEGVGRVSPLPVNNIVFFLKKNVFPQFGTVKKTILNFAKHESSNFEITGKSDGPVSETVSIIVSQKNSFEWSHFKWLAKWCFFLEIPPASRSHKLGAYTVCSRRWVLFQVTNGWLA